MRPFYLQTNADGFQRRQTWRPEAARTADRLIRLHILLEADKIDVEKARAVGLGSLVLQRERRGVPTEIVQCNEKTDSGYVVNEKAAACVHAGQQSTNAILAAMRRFCQKATDESLEELCFQRAAEFDDLRLDIDDILSGDDFVSRPIDEHMAAAVAYADSIRSKKPAVAVK